MILRNCRILPELSDGADFELADIEIKDNKIKAVRPAEGGAPNTGDLDLSGCTLLPGLMDLHVHIVPDESPNEIYWAFEAYHEAVPMLGKFLDKGVTTVRDCGSSMSLALRLRDGVNRGFYEGPRILSSGRILSPECMRVGENLGIHYNANGPDECMKAARKMFAEGADFIKIYATQSITQVRGQDPKPIYTPEEIRAMVAVAAENNSYVAAHAHSTLAINRCIANGVRSVEHSTYMDDESIRLFLSTPDSWPVLTHACSALYERGEGEDPKSEIEFWSREDIRESSRRCRAAEGRAFAAGIDCGFGTDLFPDNFLKYPYEFQIRTGFCGMTPLDTLKQATMVSARIAMLGDCLGQIKEGYIADLVAVKGKPDEDILLMHEAPAMVMKDGKAVRGIGVK